jgi:hypothetical protein
MSGERNVPGAPGVFRPEAAVNSPASRFDPSQLNVQPRPGYMNMPGYSPFLLEQERDRFILHNPRSGVAGNPFGPAFEIPSKKPSGQPALPGENKKMVEDVYGRPGPQPMPGTPPLGLPMAGIFGAGIFGAGNIAGLLGQGLPLGYVNRTVS